EGIAPLSRWSSLIASFALMRGVGQPIATHGVKKCRPFTGLYATMRPQESAQRDPPPRRLNRKPVDSLKQPEPIPGPFLIRSTHIWRLWRNKRASNARKIRHRVGSAETILVASYFSKATAPRKYGTVLV